MRVPARSRMLSIGLPPCARAFTGAMQRCWSTPFRAGFRRRSARSMTRAIRNVGSGRSRHASTLLNDAITREAFARGAVLIDLRLICDRDEDFANPVEPSARGGAKIAQAILGFVRETKPSSTVIAN